MFYLLVWILAAGVCSAGWLWTFWCKNWASSRGIKAIHRPLVPFVGNWWPLFTVRTSRGELYSQVYREHDGEDMVATFGLLKAAVVVREPRQVLRVLSQDFDHFADRDILGDPEVSPVDAGLVVINGPAWKSSRQSISPAFTSANIKAMLPIMLDKANLLVQYISRREGLDLKVNELTSMYSTDIVACCFFGLDVRSALEPDCEFSIMCKRVFHMTKGHLIKFLLGTGLPWNVVSKLTGASLTPPDLANYFTSVLERAITDRRSSSSNYRKDILQLLLDLQEKNASQDTELTDSSLVAHAYTFLSAGLDTTALGLGFALMELGRHPELQKRARKEVHRVLGPGQPAPQYDQLKQMTFLEHCIQETLRLYPAVASLYRLCTRAYTFDNGVRLFKGDAVVLPLLGLHTDPNYFSDPLSFNPDRFTTDSVQKGTYFPFGDGPRICIGMHFAMLTIKMALAMILYNFEVITSSKMRYPVDFDPTGFTLIPKEPLLCSFIKLDENIVNEEGS